MLYTREQIEKTVKEKGYTYFKGPGNYDVNIVGVRNSDTGKTVTNLFDDKITLSYKLDGVWQYHEWDNTTEPGKKGVTQYHNANGVARLVPGQYRGVYAISKHQGKYEALCQRLGNVTVWRDKNKNMTFDEVETDTGMFGINIHKAGSVSNFVENWSEGCQVFKRSKDFDAFMKIINKAKTSPDKFWTDSGGEFLNINLDKLRKKYNIDIYQTYGLSKAAIVEKYNQYQKKL